MADRFPAIFTSDRKIGLADAGWSQRKSAAGSGQLRRIFRWQVGKLDGGISRRC